MTTSGISTFPTAHRVSNGVHGCTTNAGTDALPAIATGFADYDAAMLGISDGANCGPAGTWNAAYFAAWKSDLSPSALAGIQSRTHAGTAAELTAPTGLHLDVVHNSTQRYCTERHAIAGVRLAGSAAFDPGTSNKPFRSKNVSFLAVGVLHECNSGTAVGIVLNMSHCADNAIFIALEVDDAIEPLVATTAMLGRDLALIVAAALFLVTDAQVFLRTLVSVGDFREIADRSAAAAWCYWFVEANAHG